MQWLTKIKWKKRGPGTEENTRKTQKQARKTTGKTEKAEKEEAQMPQIAEKHQKRSNCTYVELVQTNMSEIQHSTGRRTLYC